MDGALRKELKKLDQEYSYEKTVHIGRYVRNNTDGARTISDDFPRRVRFELGEQKEETDSNSWLQNVSNALRSRAVSLRVILADWIFLAILGIIVAFLSASIDTVVYYFQQLQHWTVQFTDHTTLTGLGLTYIAFVCYCTVMLVTSATLVHYISPQAIGSGIPEMKTIIRGVILKDYLTFRTLVSKILGLSFALGSGIPIGKMGSFVHIASVVANQLSLFAARFDPAFGSESRRMETLSAACAVGVACTFSSPVGGVLFSIEVTTMYFSVRNYWRGFFAACCGATTIRLLKGVFAETEVTTNAFFQTSFNKDAFVADELPLFALLGFFCGIIGALYVALYKHLVLFLRTNHFAKKIFQQHWVVYPIVVSLLLSTMMFPHGVGQYITGRMTFSLNLKDFFANCTFTQPPGTPLSCGNDIYAHWIGEAAHDNVIVLIVLFVIALFISSIISVTLPVPTGIFMPVFVLGAGFGRLLGELVSIMMPNGFTNGLHIYPGIYAVVGAASLCGAVSHSVSISVIVFEATGQLHFILPVMIAVIIANAVCTYLQPSFFETMIKIKHLPFLPDIPPSSSIVHSICAENIMASPVMFLTRMTTYEEIRNCLVEGNSLRIIPLVDAKETQMLIGTVSRRALLAILEQHVGDNARKVEAERRVKKAIETIDMHFKHSQREMGEMRPRSDYDIVRSVCVDDIVPHRRTRSESFGSCLDDDRSITTSRNDIVEEYNPPFPRRESRFMVTPAVETPKVIFPIERKSSFVARRNAFCSIQEGASKDEGEHQKDEHPNGSISPECRKSHHLSLHAFQVDYHNIAKSYVKQAKKYIHALKGNSKKDSTHFSMYDLLGNEREEWELCRLKDEVTFSEELIDASPFQLVKKTSLHKIHSIFSMLQLSKVYVTECGRLIGVVALSDVRRALENEGEVVSEATQIKEDIESDANNKRFPTIRRETSDNIHDVLTPTLEIVCQNTLPSESIYLDPNELTMRRKESVLRHPPVLPNTTNLSFFNERGVGSIDHPTEDLVEAVAYLRRKSILIPEKSISKTTKNNKDENT